APVMRKLVREIGSLSARTDPMRAAEARQDLVRLLDEPVALEIGVLLSTCFPALAQAVRAAPADVTHIAREGWRTPRTRASLMADVRARAAQAPDEAR